MLGSSALVGGGLCGAAPGTGAVAETAPVGAMSAVGSPEAGDSGGTTELLIFETAVGCADQKPNDARQ